MNHYKVTIEGQRPVRVSAASARNAVIDVLSKRGLRYACTKFRVIPIHAPEPQQS